MKSRYPFVETIKAPNVIKRLETLFWTFGYPNKIRSDNGSLFQSEQLKFYFDDKDIKHIKITPRYPQANEANELFMQVIEKISESKYHGKVTVDASQEIRNPRMTKKSEIHRKGTTKSQKFISIANIKQKKEMK